MKKKVIFHVINSVKGGSGKSTFSLLLANHFIRNKQQTAYIIDLDLHGTSWEKNYYKFFDDTVGQKKVYLNDLMYDFSNNITQEFIRNLRVSNKNDETHTVPDKWSIPVCVSNPNQRGIDEVELDLFENAIYKLINRIIERESGNDSEYLHIIFDMPPSKEKHSEKILSHLLLDKSSYLNKRFPYYVCLYMISAISPAHIELNLEYVRSMFKDKSYSSTIMDFINRKDKHSYFHLCLILNDVINNSSKLPGMPFEIIKTLGKKVKITNVDHLKKMRHTGSLKHLSLCHHSQILAPYGPTENSDTELSITDSTMSDFEDYMNAMTSF